MADWGFSDQNYCLKQAFEDKGDQHRLNDVIIGHQKNWYSRKNLYTSRSLPEKTSGKIRNSQNWFNCLSNGNMPVTTKSACINVLYFISYVNQPWGHFCNAHRLTTLGRCLDPCKDNCHDLLPAWTCSDPNRVLIRSASPLSEMLESCQGQ